MRTDQRDRVSLFEGNKYVQAHWRETTFSGSIYKEPTVTVTLFNDLSFLTPLKSGDLAALGLAVWSLASLSSWMIELINASTGLP